MRVPCIRAGGAYRDTLLQTLAVAAFYTRSVSLGTGSLGLRPVCDPSLDPGTGLAQRDRSHAGLARVCGGERNQRTHSAPLLYTPLLYTSPVMYTITQASDVTSTWSMVGHVLASTPVQ